MTGLTSSGENVVDVAGAGVGDKQIPLRIIGGKVRQAEVEVPDTIANHRSMATLRNAHHRFLAEIAIDNVAIAVHGDAIGN